MDEAGDELDSGAQPICDRIRRPLSATVERKGVYIELFTGSVQLSDLFGEHEDLIVIHNMGVSCPYCTLWADGFNGLIRHLEDRAAFVMVSPDPPDIQKEFAK
jgi:predicted dithiol-disulfide oxidoreductase (DUF899 family)